MNNLIQSNRVSDPELLAALPDDLLLGRAGELVARERSSTAELVAHLAEIELRRLYLGLACSSMFTYCTQRLRLSEDAAYARIEVARATRRFPDLLPRLADGSLSLTGIRRLAPVLTSENCSRLLAEARHKSTRELERLVAREQPRPDAPPKIRRLPRPTERSGRSQHVAQRVPVAGLPLSGLLTQNDIAPSDRTPSPSDSARADRATIQPTAPDRYRVQFTASEEMRSRIARLRDLLRHRIPDGDLAAVIDAALIDLLAKLEQKKYGGEVSTPRSKPTVQGRSTAAPVPSKTPAAHSRRIAQAVRREVWRRDAGRCRFIASSGARCTATGFVEFHHLAPFARGGGGDITNLELRCHAHNAHEAECEGLGRRLR